MIALGCTSDTHTLAVTKSSLIRLKTRSTQENHAWYKNLSQQPRANDVTILEENLQAPL